MTSLDIVSFKSAIEQFINESELPKEVIRMILKEIYIKAEKSAYDELMSQVGEGDDNGKESADTTGTKEAD